MEGKTTSMSLYDEVPTIKEKTLPEYYLAKAEQFAKEGRRDWIIDPMTGETRLFSRFDEETKKIASAFYKLGLKKGDVVLHMMKDLCKLFIFLNGVWRSNGVVRVTYPDDDFGTILHRVKESKVRFIVCEAEEEAVAMCKNVAASCGWTAQVITVNPSSSSELPSIQDFLDNDDGADCPDFLLKEDDPSIILCTSGTTGLPKGAVHTQKSLLYQTRTYEVFPFTLHKPNFISSKATHISATCVGLTLLGCGKTGVLLSNITQENIFYSVDKYKPGFIFAFPPYILEMVGPAAQGYDFSSLEVVLVGGMPITPTTFNTIRKLPNVKDVVVSYGLTENTLATTSSMPQREHGQPCSIRDLPDFSVGKPFPGTEFQVRDPVTQEVLEANQKGELYMKSLGVFQSYLNNPEATNEAFVDGYFKSGDLGYYDENGFIYLVDRLKEIFKYRGNHISPSEIENVIGKHPYVRQVCVVGVPYECEHVPRAFVTLHSPDGDTLQIAEEIKQFANANLASYKQLRGGLYIIDELPKGKTGKISRLLVQKLEV